jgi:methyl-accepting chemotaxis protein
VKKLANETEQATERVSSIVAAIRRDTEQAVGGLGAIRAAIGNASEGQATIGSAVDQQTMATGDIRQAAASMADVVAVAHDSTARIRQLATDLAATGDELSHVVGRFRVGAGPTAPVFR